MILPKLKEEKELTQEEITNKKFVDSMLKRMTQEQYT